MKLNLAKGSSLADMLRAIAEKKKAERAKNPPPPIKKSKIAAKPATRFKFKPATFWQLPLDNVLNVGLEPWPAKAGPAKLKVEITPFEGPEAFEGKVAFRIAKTQSGAGDWTSMKKTTKNDRGNVYYDAPIKLAKGAAYIQFRLHGQAEEGSGREFTELNDWQIKIK